MRFRNPFRVTEAPVHFTAERELRHRHIIVTGALALFLCLVGVVYTPFIVHLVRNDAPLTHQTLGQLWDYTRMEFSNQWREPHKAMLVPGFIPESLRIFRGHDANELAALFIYCGVGMLFGICGMLRNLTQPYSKLVKKADASWATEDTVRAMEANDQVGVKGGFLMALGRWQGGYRDGQMVQMIETLSALCLAPPGTGKCLAPEELVMMHDGTVRMNCELKVGDLLMGPDGGPRRVLQTQWGYGPMYEVTPIEGRSFRCNGDHILSLRCSKAPRNRSVNPVRGAIRHVTVDEWMGWSQEQRGKWKQWRAAVDFPERAAPTIDPYLVGLILGDGSTVERVGVHTADDVIVDDLREKADAHGLAVRETRQVGNASAYFALTAGRNRTGKGANSICDAIREMGLHVAGADKFIPQQIKTGSREVRLAVLAGFLDADGWYDPAAKGYEFTQLGRRLAEDVAFVARSLGFSAYPKEVRKVCGNNGVVGTYWRTHICGEVDRIPVKLLRRVAEPRVGQKDVTNVGFDIRPIGMGRWFGIVIDGDRQFLLDDFTVTHNTAGLVIPTLISCDQVSCIVNDPKPELYEATGAYRAKIGVVHMLNWSFTNKIVMKPVFRDGVPVFDAAGNPIETLDPDKSIIYPSFNPLDPKVVPGYGPQRDTYIDAIAKSLIADSKGGDSYFTDKGRAALTGFIHCLVATVNDAKDYDDLPPEWHGMEASIPMLVDWVANALFAASGDAEVDPTFMGPEDEMVQPEKPEDPMGAWIRKIAEKVKPPKSGYRVGCSDRAFKELASLISMADKERSGILGTMDQALLPFKNAAVKERTSTSSFAPDDLRGYFKPEIEARTRLDPSDPDYLDPQGSAYKLLYKDKRNWLPVTLYVCVNQAEAEAFANITALLFQVLSRTFLSYKPNDWNDRTGRFLGPFPICFVMDEFAKLPKIDAVLTGPDLGRSMKTSYMLVAQDYSQIEKTYGKELVRTINSTCSVKYILSQNETETKKMIVDMVGKTTIMRQSESNTKGIGKGVNAFQYNASETAEEVDFLRDGDIMGMEKGTHLVLVQNFNNRPMKLRTALYFKDESMRTKVRARGEGPIADQVLPPHVREAELARLAERMRAKVVNNLEVVEAQRAKAFEFCGDDLDHDA